MLEEAEWAAALQKVQAEKVREEEAAQAALAE